MNTKQYFLFILISFPGILYSQKDTSKSRWNISASAGVSPAGGFAAGYAYSRVTGCIFAIEVLKNSIFDIDYKVSYNSNNLNLNWYLNDPNNGMGTYEEAIKNETFKEVNALAGFSIPFPKHSKKISLNATLLLGVSDSFLPYMEYYSFSQNIVTPNHIFINPTGSLSIILDLGLDIKVPIHKRIFVLVGIDYFNTVANWRTTEQIDNSSVYISQTFSVKSSIELLNFNGGVGYKF